MEWQVFGVVVALLGFTAAVVGPIVRLNSSITRLTVTMERIVKDIDAQRAASREAHKRLWQHNEAQDRAINGHEVRITTLERQDECSGP